MENVFKFLFERELSDDESETLKKKVNEYRAAGGFLPSDSNYDPQMRLKRRLKLLFPHLPATPGLPPRLDDED